MAIRVFGLTGGVASGKSTVAARFRERGLEVIDADRIARDVVAPGTAGLVAVVEAFGGQVLREDGSLDRAGLGRLVFADERARRRLEAIVHPRIRAESARRIETLQADGTRLACYEAALLVENGLADSFRPLVVVSLAPDEQRRRLMERDGIDAAEAERRIGSQLPLARKRILADLLIENDGDIALLRVRADEVLAAIIARCAAEPG